MKKRCLCLSLLALFLLSGCCLSHEWAAATCTAPETCSKCGETQGEALGHDWQAATCTAAETCSKCGETQGEALAHSWLAANYQQPERCSVCGEENGEPLTPEFVEHGLKVIDVDMSGDKQLVGSSDSGMGAMWNGEADYITCGYPDDSKKAEGSMEIKITTPQKYAYSYYSGKGVVTLDADELIAKMGLEPLEGYTLVHAYAEIDFNAPYGVSMGTCFEDYYTIVAHDESVGDEGSVLLGDLEFGVRSYVVNINGEVMTAYRVYNGHYGEMKGSSVTWYSDQYYYIPDGYDGTVVGFYNRANKRPDGAYVFDVANEDTLFYRIIT